MFILFSKNQPSYQKSLPLLQQGELYMILFSFLNINQTFKNVQSFLGRMDNKWFFKNF